MISLPHFCFQLQCGFFGVLAICVRAIFYFLVHVAIIQRSLGSNIDRHNDCEVSL